MSERGDRRRGLLADIRGDIEDFLAGDSVEVAEDEVRLSHTERLPTTLADAWKELRRSERVIEDLRKEREDWDSIKNTEVNACKREARDLEHTIASLERRMETDRLKYARLEESSLRMASVGDAEVAELSTARSAAISEWREDREKHVEAQRKLSTTVAQLKEHISSMEQQRFEVQAAHQEELSSRDARIRQLERQQHSAKDASDNEERPNYDDKVQELLVQKRALTRASQEAESLRFELDRMRSEVARAQAQMEEGPAEVDVMRKELERFRTVDAELRSARREIATLSSLASRAEMLSEENVNLRGSVERLEAEVRRHASANEEAEPADERLAEWSNLFQGVVEDPSPTGVVRALRDLQREHALLLDERGRHDASTVHAGESVKFADSIIFRLRQQVASLEDSLEESRLATERHARKLRLASQEQLAYKNIMDTYVREAPSGSDSVELARIQQLESVIQAQSSTLSSLEEDLATKSKEVLQLRGDLRQRDEKLRTEDTSYDKLKAEKESLEVEVEALAKSHAELESKLGKGHYNKTTTKVLHFGLNPAKKAKMKEAEYHETILKENEALKSAIRALQEQPGVAIAVPAAVANITDKTEVVKLKQSLEQSEKRQARLKEAFRQKIGEWREAIQELLGFQIDFLASHRFGLRSVFAESKEQYLVFQSIDKKYELLETEFSKTLTKEIEAYLVRCRSIPAFLAHVTMELFNQQTFMS